MDNRNSKLQKTINRFDVVCKKHKDTSDEINKLISRLIKYREEQIDLAEYALSVSQWYRRALSTSVEIKKGYSIIQDDLLKEEYKNVTQGELNKFCFDINTLSSKCKKQLDELVDKDI